MTDTCTVTVSATALTNVGSGTATASSLSNPNYKLPSANTKTFYVTQKSATVTTAPTAKSNLTYNLSDQTLANGGTATNGTMKYSLDNSTWSTIIPMGKAAKTYTVYYKAAATSSNYKDSASSSITVTIAKKSVSGLTINLSKTSATYTGSAQTSSVSSVKDGSTTLTATTDYTSSWNTSDFTNAGTKTLTITGTGNYTGTKTATYTISACSLSSCTVNISNYSKTYNGSVQTPNISVKIGSTTISSSYYSVKYTKSGSSTSITNPKDAGTYTVTVTGNTNLTGTKNTSNNLTIAQKSISGATVSLSESSYTWSGSDCKPTVSSVTLSGWTPTITYSTSYQSDTASAGSKTVTVTGSGNYTGTATGTYTINRANVDAPSAVTGLIYNGSSQTGVVESSTYYTLTGNTATDAGDHTATATADNNHCFDNTQTTTSKTISWSIAKKDATVTAVNASKTYGEADPTLTATTTGTVGSETLSYTLARGQGNDVGSYTITPSQASGDNSNYNVTFNTATFTINKRELTVTPNAGQTKEYDGTGTVSNLTHTDTNAVSGETPAFSGEFALEDRTSYDVASDYTINKGTLALTDGDGFKADNYTLTVDETVTFAITKRPVTLTSDTKSKEYDGTALTSQNVTAGGSGFVDGQGASYTFKDTSTVTNVKDGEVDNDFDYTLNESTTKADNYDITKALGKLSITKATPAAKYFDFTATGSPFTYDGQSKSASVSLKSDYTGAGTVSLAYYKDSESSADGNHKNAGTYTVKASFEAGDNFKEASDVTDTSWTFDINKADLKAEYLSFTKPDNLTYNGSSKDATLELTSPYEDMGEVTYKYYKDSASAEDSAHKDAGSYVVKASVAEGNNFKATTTDLSADGWKFIVSPKTAELAWGEITSWTYDGGSHAPTCSVNNLETGDSCAVTVDGAKTDARDTAYTATASSLDNSNYTLTGAEGTTQEFTINKRDVTLTSADDTKMYDGSALTNSTVTVTSGSFAEGEGASYDVTGTITDYGTTGTAKNTFSYTFTGGGKESNYNITKAEGTLSITKRSVTMTSATATKIYDGKALTNDTVAVTGDGFVEGEGATYTVSGTVTNVSEGTVDNTFSYTLYESTVGSQKITKAENYTIETVKGKLSITQRDISSNYTVTPSASSFEYSGDALYPTVTSVTPDPSLTDYPTPVSTDYDVSYANNDGSAISDPDTIKDAGSYKVVVTGKGNYKGSANAGFTINKGTISSVSVDPDSLPYTGSPRFPDTVTVTGSNGKTLTKDTDYSITHTTNTDKGTVTITITGINNFDGSTKTTTFDITAKSIAASDVSVTLGTSSYVYDGLAKEPSVTVTDTGRTATEQTLLTPKDYTLTYSENTSAGTAHVKVDGQGNYADTRTSDFTIEKRSINTATRSFAALTYNGYDLEPVPTVTYNNGTSTLTLVTGDDYTVAYFSDESCTTSVTVKDAGTYWAKFTGKGTNWTGEATTSFTVQRATTTTNFLDYSNQGSPFTYDGSDKSASVTLKTEPAYSGMGQISVAYYKVDGGSVATSPTDKPTDVGTYQVKASVDDTGKNFTQATDLTAEGWTIEIVQRPVTVKWDSTALVYDGTLQAPAASVDNLADIDANKVAVTVTGAQTEASAEGAHYTAEASALAAGTAGDRTANYTLTGGTNLSYDFTIGKADLTKLTSDKFSFAGPESTVYSGSAKDATVKLAESSGLTKAGEVSYKYFKNGTEDAAHKDVGTYIVKASFTGGDNFNDASDITFDDWTFTVSQKPLTNEDISIAAIDDQTYTGSQIKPSPVVTDTGRAEAERTLNLNGDYTIKSYANNTNVASSTSANPPTVTVEGTGNYSGEISKTFNITQKSVSDDDVEIAAIETVTYDTTSHEPTLNISYGTQSLQKTTDYTVIYTNSKSETKNPDQLINADTYTATITGTGNYTGTKSITFTIDPKDIGKKGSGVVIQDLEVLTYDGTKREPTVQGKVYDGTKLLFEGGTSDYTKSYTNNVNAGTDTASVTITGQNNYTGTLTKKFSIARKPFNDNTTVSDVENVTYTGSAVTPTPTVTDTEISQTPLGQTDYELKYENNLNASTEGNPAKVTITGKESGNYSGSIVKTFTIAPKNAKDQTEGKYDVSIAPIPDVVYTGNPLTPSLDNKVTFAISGGTQTLIEGTDKDYSVEYSNNVYIGENTAKATLTFHGNFTGTREVNFSIVPQTKPISDEKVIIEAIADEAYDGSAHEPKVVIHDKDRILASGEYYQLVDDKDYTLSYKNNTNAGTATITITGLGSYTDLRTKTFTITQRAFSYASVAAMADVTYTGFALSPNPEVADAEIEKTLVKDVDYTLSYENNTDVGTGTVTVTGTGNYTADEKTQNFTIVPKGVDGLSIAAIPNQTYTGSEIKPAPVVTDPDRQGATLVGGTDYSVEYANNVKVGTATITLTFDGNYEGSRTTSFNITRAANQRLVSFDAGNGKTYESIIVADGEAYGDLPIPTKQGYVFEGWYYGDNKITAQTEQTAHADHTLVAKWLETDASNAYMVPSGVDSDGHVTFETYATTGIGSTTEVIASTSDTNDETMSAYAKTSANATFDGWYSTYDAASNTFSGKVTLGTTTQDKVPNRTLYARFTCEVNRQVPNVTDNSFAWIEDTSAYATQTYTFGDRYSTSQTSNNAEGGPEVGSGLGKSTYAGWYVKTNTTTAKFVKEDTQITTANYVTKGGTIYGRYQDSVTRLVPSISDSGAFSWKADQSNDYGTQVYDYGTSYSLAQVTQDPTGGPAGASFDGCYSTPGADNITFSTENAITTNLLVNGNAEIYAKYLSTVKFAFPSISAYPNNAKLYCSSLDDSNDKTSVKVVYGAKLSSDDTPDNFSYTKANSSQTKVTDGVTEGVYSLDVDTLYYTLTANDTGALPESKFVPETTVIKDNITVYGRLYGELNFNCDGVSEPELGFSEGYCNTPIANQTRYLGEKFEKPSFVSEDQQPQAHPDPSDPNKYFWAGWGTKADSNSAFDFDQAVCNTTCYAVYSNNVKITFFYPDGNSDYERAATVTGSYGKKVSFIGKDGKTILDYMPVTPAESEEATIITPPDMQAYSVAGFKMESNIAWYTDIACTQPFEFNTTMKKVDGEAMVNLYSKWITNVDFRYGSSYAQSQTDSVVYGDTLTTPDISCPADFELEGWYSSVSEASKMYASERNTDERYSGEKVVSATPKTWYAGYELTAAAKADLKVVSDAVTAIYMTANIEEGTPLSNEVYNSDVAAKIKLARLEYDTFAAKHSGILNYAADKLAELEACEKFRMNYYDPKKVNKLVKVVSGSAQVIDIDSESVSSVQISFSDALSNFIYIKIDGVELSATQYQASEKPFIEESTESRYNENGVLLALANDQEEDATDTSYILLDTSYVKSLSVGEHEVLMTTDNGTAQTTLTMTKTEPTPDPPKPEPTPDPPTPTPTPTPTPSPSVDNGSSASPSTSGSSQASTGAATSSSTASTPSSSPEAATDDAYSGEQAQARHVYYPSAEAQSGLPVWPLVVLVVVVAGVVAAVIARKRMKKGTGNE